MDQSFFIYLEKFEFIGFFAGYPLIYLISVLLFEKLKKSKFLQLDLLFLLPCAYSLIGVLFFGLQIKKLYPDFSMEHFRQNFYHTGLYFWALLSLFFFLPVLRKKPIWSMLHSLVFFYLIFKDLFLRFYRNADPLILQNDMRVYTDSLLLNAACVAGTLLIYFFLRVLKKRQDSGNNKGYAK